MAPVASLEELAEQARAAASRGEREYASRLWHDVLDRDADHPAALNALGNALLARGSPGEARAMLDRAAIVAPGQPAILFNLAAACRATGDIEAALAALEEALAVEPYFVAAIFQKANLLEQHGRTRDAAAIYRDFLDAVSSEVRDSGRFAGQIGHAEAFVAQDRAVLRARIESDAVAPTARTAHAAAVLLGDERCYVAQPTFLTVPELPALPFFPRALAPWLDDLERHAPAIAAEAERLLSDSGDAARLTPYVANAPGTPLNQWRDLDHNDDWSALFLYKHGARIDQNCRRFPATAAALDAVPLFDVPDRGPNVFFSILRAGTRVPPHTGVTNARATAHLALVVPDGCTFRVGADRRSWKAGEAWLFDDSIEHEAHNGSDRDRIVLLFDVWNPLIETGERIYLRHLLDSYAAHHGRGGMQDMAR